MNEVKSNYVLITIGKIDESFLKVMIFGKVIEKGDDFVRIDDGSGAVKVLYNHENLDFLSKVELGDTLMVLGKVVKLDSDVVVFADISKIINDFNLKQLMEELKEKEIS
ncbi:MAG: hypothetical protein GXN99_00990 [Candidatus Nanohaloarchaeota archaeon]|nr:hypothetical protein [Candidatus Nanohaloarchaeota archaeon]